ncbi:vWA domain-containing protein [Lysinibacillus xylanilyticus]|uniref:BatA and WFA domain-containing protein n=1 Tax=Lysinibacillus xylanilyticus TaxID=582475 RepID=A0ABT4ELV4_9BACI|nr:BatA and WFA domain-containing protein [Lysinibacillus xylanilyticus]MCY9546596.1 BatA and WFA domain-containing protein [Lysinibacillus xylanilyticus]
MGFSQLLFSWTAIIPVIVLLYYFFRKKYTDQTVSSTLFWSEIMQETRVSPYLKHLQKNALLYLQLLALLLLVLALMNPYVKKSTIVGAQTIFIVDTSATMSAGKEQSTFDTHKKEMLSLVNELDGRPVTLITTGNTPKAIIQQETNTKNIEKAIQELQVTYETAQMNKALDVAQAFVGNTPTSIYVFTDSLDKKQLPMEKDTVKWIVKGSEKDLTNIAITRFAATTDGQSAMALVQLQNDTDQEQTVTLSIENVKGKEVIAESVALPPNEAITKTFKDLPLEDTMTAKIDAKDDYAVDNSQTVLLQTTTSKIVVDQSMHQLIQKGLQTINSSVKIVPSSQMADNRDVTLVTNQTALLEKMDKPIVLFGRDDVEKIEVTGEVGITSDALLAFSELKDIYVSALYPGFNDYKTIATVGDQPFIQRSPKGDIVVLADIADTDWPLHPSFPLFLWSAEQELSESIGSLGIFTPNEQRAVAITQGDWSIYSQEDEFLSSITNGLLTAPMKPGIYTARSNDEEKRFIVQLQAQERVIEKGTSYTLGELPDNGKEEISKASFVPWFILIILVLLVLEWEVQRRRGFTN